MCIRDSPKGYYEFERVKQMDKGDVAWVAEARGKAVKVISALLKHLPADEQYRVIFIRRNIDEILASQRKMLIHRGEDPDKQDDATMKVLFEKHVRGVCLLYTSDAADERSSVDLGGRRIIKKKNSKITREYSTLEKQMETER